MFFYFTKLEIKRQPLYPNIVIEICKAVQSKILHSSRVEDYGHFVFGMYVAKNEVIPIKTITALIHYVKSLTTEQLNIICALDHSPSSRVNGDLEFVSSPQDFVPCEFYHQ